ncbi:MAG: hypothetical protein DMG57_41560 [Acidobacteria bacterium]|nr:MAG: hypothetical protein DMG57_41560 [Acidobacteriota bacterium]
MLPLRCSARCWLKTQIGVRDSKKEARAVAALNHPNIVSLFDIGSDDEILYTVSELIDADSLRAMLR